jgi:hypothetical protein
VAADACSNVRVPALAGCGAPLVAP